MPRTPANLAFRAAAAFTRGLRLAASWCRAALCVLVLFTTLQNTAAQTGAQEYQVKAAFVYNFTKFVNWPPQAMRDGPFVIGIYGHNVFNGHLEEATKGRSVAGKSIVVRMVHTAAAARDTHILFVPAAEDDRVPELIDALRGSNVLLVGESEAFARRGGAITFVFEEGKLRFEIDLAAAKRAGVQLNSQLLSLAKSIRGK